MALEVDMDGIGVELADFVDDRVGPGGGWTAETEGVDSAGSAGVSRSSSDSSWRPIGFRGSRRVPLFGFGVKPTVPQMML
jgi:hypothetical protein